MNISISPDAIHALEGDILAHPEDWGAFTPEQARWAAEVLIRLRWLVRTDRLRGDCERWLP